MKKLVVMCGPSRVGKSTYVEKMEGKWTVINSDSIRMELTGRRSLGSVEEEGEVWNTFNRRKLEAFKNGEDVVLDACHTSPQSRWHSLQNAEGYKVTCVLFIVRLKTVLNRCREVWVEEMWRAFDSRRPSKMSLVEEGFDNVRIVRG